MMLKNKGRNLPGNTILKNIIKEGREGDKYRISPKRIYVSMVRH
jgi:hypothetical protein